MAVLRESYMVAEKAVLTDGLMVEQMVGQMDDLWAGMTEI